MARKVLVTGGAGYIGSTIASAVIDRGDVPVILDDFSKGREEFVAGRAWYAGDVADGAAVDRVFADHPEIDTVVHCAAKIVVPESVAQPLAYYDNNVAKLLPFLAHLQRHGCRRIIFSSSASIYAPGEDFTVDESSSLAPSSPYARTKVMAEYVLSDTAAAAGMAAVSLRYFNPIGADPALRTGLADPRPTHVLGKLIEAYETGEKFTVTGTDWPTRDGSAIRDYIHVWDLAQAHVLAIDALRDGTITEPWTVVNVGTGDGTTVRELLAAFREATGADVPATEAPPRPGDVVGCYTRSDRARTLLGWTPQLSIAQGIRDSLAWTERRARVLGG